MGGMAKNSYNSGRGPSQRQLRVGEVIRRTMSELLMRGEIHDPDLNQLSITVSEVRVTPDLKVATAFVLPLGGKGKDEAIALLANGDAAGSVVLHLFNLHRSYGCSRRAGRGPGCLG